MARMEMSFALYDSLLRARADREGILFGEVYFLCDFNGAKVETIRGDDRRFLAIISHRDEQVLKRIIESSRRHLSESGVMLNGEVC
ncbi:hypothetical protein A3B60_03285 [Candidatus Peregrinibacteria bacterium RIFCSPLOWO2_01_FULL_39_12]|nr:MAG: hypothetical protein A3B60_03285 [Candidatus Peregrinibacteria bacterium RIFCSPLOWO2_01_FULL_39_12]